MFPTLEAASDFFQAGLVGYSDARTEGFQGLKLRCRHWAVEPLDVEEIRSSEFDNPLWFPPGSAEFDCGLLMRDIPHEWHELPLLKASTGCPADRC